MLERKHKFREDHFPKICIVGCLMYFRHIEGPVPVQMGMDVPTNTATMVGRDKAFRTNMDELTMTVDANGLSHIVKCLKGALGSQMFFYTCGRSDARCQINNMRARVVEWIPASVKAVLPPFTSSKNKLTLTSTRTVTEKASGVSTRSSRNSTEDSSSKSVSAQSSSTINGSSNNTPPVITSIVYRNQTIANNSDSKPMMTVGASLGIPLGLACFGFVGYLFWKRGHGQRSIPQLSDQQKARRILTPTIPESTSNELAGHFEGFELVAPHPIHEI